MILKNCRLVPELCEGFESDFADIRVEGTDIAEILPAGGTYTGEEVIDVNGKTVLPGLYNLHIHLWFKQFDNNLNKAANNVYGATRDAMHHMNTLLAYGFTSLRDVGSAFDVSKNLRDDINSGMLVGPRIKTSGLILTPSQFCGAQLNTHSDKYSRACNNAQQTRDVARLTLAENNDFIKILGSSVQPHPRGDGPLFYDDELDELALVAKKEGTYISVHTTSAESNQVYIDREFASLEHVMCLSNENIDSIVKHGYKSAIVTTASASAAWGGDQVAIYHDGNHKAAAEAGVLIGFGTDSWESYFLSEPAQEFRLRTVLGFTMKEALIQATINSAKINGDEAILGSIKVGKKADFAIVDGKPEEDYNVFNKPCAYVIKDGKLVAREGMILA